MVVIVVTGTPGTGKTELARALAGELRYAYVNLNELAEEHGLCDEYDEVRGCSIVDIAKLTGVVVKKIEHGDYVLDSHMGHHIPARYVNICIVTVCNLKLLKERLESRGYGAAKVRENLDAEVFQNCLIEAEEAGHTPLIVDTGVRLDIWEVIDTIKKRLK